MPPRGRADAARDDRPVGLDQRPALGEVRGSSAPGGSGASEKVRVDVGEGEFHRLDPRVQARLQPVEEPECDQRGGALAVRRQLAHLDAAIARRSGSTHSE